MLKKIWNGVSWVILIALLFGCFFSLKMVLEAKKTGEQVFLLGHRPVFVLTGSMEPYMRENSICVTKEVNNINELAVGDVITYHIENEKGRMIRITHRIINIDDNGHIKTKGDNNNVSDIYTLSIDNVEAKVVVVFNWVATIVNAWNSGTKGKIVVLTPISVVIMGYFLVKLLFSKDEAENTSIVTTNNEELNTKNKLNDNK